MTERPLLTVDPEESDTATNLYKETNVDQSMKSRKITIPETYDSTILYPGRPSLTVDPGESDTPTKLDKETNVDQSIKITKCKTFSHHPIVPRRHCGDYFSGKPLPTGLLHYHYKGELNLSGEHLDPSTLFSLIPSYGHNLKKLDLSGCDLHRLDLRCLERLSGLEELNLSNNALRYLHLEFFEHMPHSLKKLDVSGCDLRYVDWRCLKRLSGLEELNLSNNPLRHLDLEFLEHMRLKKLDLSGCDLPYVHWRCFIRLRGVEELNLSNNPLRHLDLEFLEHMCLKKLDLSGCGVTGQHLAGQKYLRGLEDLNLSNNPLHSIKLFSSKSMPGLRTLDISGCGLTDKDLKDFALWDGVEELNLSNNPLSHMLRHRKNLKKLNLSGCCLTTWPSGLEECSSLEQLDLSNNSFGHQDLLENLPPSVSGLSNLNRIMFEDAIYTKNDKG